VQVTTRPYHPALPTGHRNMFTWHSALKQIKTIAFCVHPNTNVCCWEIYWQWENMANGFWCHKECVHDENDGL